MPPRTHLVRKKNLSRFCPQALIFLSDIKSVIDSATSISESYSYVMQQVDMSKQTSEYVKGWIDDGFKATQTKFSTSDKQDIIIDRHGDFMTISMTVTVLTN